MRLDKRALVGAIVEVLEARLAAARAAADDARRAATHEEARAENDKDTRGLEQSYLARGQAMRAEELEEAATRLRFFDPPAFADDDPIASGALVVLACDDAEHTYFVTPVAGGHEVTLDGVRVRLVTPAAPLGAALLDKRAGDDFTLRAGGRAREYEIVRVE
ncbi:MAG: GreA/GreB family elongation factor [Sandaracinaceae bacterium]|nr:GreA/GreB family elongation factor [Sandaracinaceae bacterium]